MGRVVARSASPRQDGILADGASGDGHPRPRLTINLERQAMATHMHTTAASTTIWPLLGRNAPAPATRLDADLLILCAEFRRADIALAATPDTEEQALDAAWTARQVFAERLMSMRPVTDAGRREKARVAVTILLEVPKWQQDAEVVLALAAFRAEAFA